MNVFDYLISLPQKVLTELYSDPWTCQAIFRSLPSLAKNYVLRLLFAAGGVPITNWIPKGSDHQTLQAHKKSIERLIALKLCTQQSNSTRTGFSDTVLQLNSEFRDKLRLALCHTGSPPWMTTTTGESLKQDKHAPDTKTLIEGSYTCWEALLRFMIGTPTHMPSENLAELLVRKGLMQLEEDDKLRITNVGFKFLLKDTHTQIWTLLLAYIEASEDRGMDKKEVLSFLFQLSFLTFGKDYPVDRLTETQKKLLQDLREFGILYQRNSSSRRFYPTQLALALSSGKAENAEDQKKVGDQFIVLEANYRLYAYTSSDLQISILSLFTKMKYRLPNLAVGVITRESIRAALMNGITASEVITYLQKYAHPEMQKNFPVIPETVSDQIRLWEAERNRVTYDRGVIYDGFNTDEIFNSCVKYAKDIGIYVWHHQTKKYMMIVESGYESMRQYMKRYQ